MKNNILITIIIPVLLVASACEHDILKMPSTKKTDVFECFWKGIDVRYSFFDLKNIDWEAIHAKYSLIISDDMSDEAFFDTLSVLIDFLQDGHSGLKSPFNEYKYIGFYTRGPENVNERVIVDNYAKGYGNVTGPLRHFSLHNGDIGYIYYGSFSKSISDDDMDYIISKYKDTKGLIIDIRNNYGGSADNIFKIVKRFIETETHLYSSKIKNGPAHNNFSGLTKTIVAPSSLTYTNKVCVLTNRKVFSAASIFTLAMKECPNVTIVGDTTGGGLGLPVGFEITNGWQVTCAGSQILSVDGQCYEMGIPPDVQVDLTDEDINKGVDSIIEKAIKILLEE